MNVKMLRPCHIFMFQGRGYYSFIHYLARHKNHDDDDDDDKDARHPI